MRWCGWLGYIARNFAIENDTSKFFHKIHLSKMFCIIRSLYLPILEYLRRFWGGRFVGKGVKMLAKPE